MSSNLVCRCIVLATILGLSPGGLAGNNDEAVLRELLDGFLAAASEVAAHERFWADDLVYTSSNGTRTDKAAIIEGLRAAEAAEPGGGVIYSADDVDIRLYGNTAVVAFRLVARVAPGSAPESEYFNTGTFLKRADEWRAVAWQATRIAAPAIEPHATERGSD